MLDKAIEFATRAHSGQMRKGASTPYILHPLEAASICATITDDQEILSAAVLHDVVEDTDATIDLIEAEFGPRVAALVAGESEDKRVGLPSAETWRIRKEETIERLETTKDPAVRLVCLGDKLSNMRAIHRDFDELGDALWERFNQKAPVHHAWYYRSLAEILRHDFGETAAWRELSAHVGAVFGNIPAICPGPEGAVGDAQNAGSSNGHWYCAATEEELADLLEMFWDFHDFRIEQIDFNAAADCIDLQLEYDTHEFRVLLRFIGCAYMNFGSGYWYPADWLQGASLGLGSQGQVVWAADEGVDTKELPDDILWISGFTLNYAMLGKDGCPMEIPAGIVHQVVRGYDFRLRKDVETVKDFHPRRLSDFEGAQADGADS